MIAERESMISQLDYFTNRFPEMYYLSLYPELRYVAFLEAEGKQRKGNRVIKEEENRRTRLINNRSLITLLVQSLQG